MLRKQLEINNFILLLLFFSSGLGYYWLGYQTERSNFTQVITIVGSLFACYYFINRFWNKNYPTLNILGILFRVLLIGSFPNLSDDIYRFLWDGRILANGDNPFLYLPTEAINLGYNGVDQLHLEQLNSPNYYTIYPPFLQYCFGLVGLIFPAHLLNATICLKVLIILAEIGTIWLITQLLRAFNIDPKYSTLYALNPLVIIELSGNVHFEAFMIFFSLLAIYLLQKQRLLLSASSLALAVSSKLLPLMFLPFLFRRIGFRKTIVYSLTVLAVNLILFAPFLTHELFYNLFSSIDLYFQKFEFNASFYYVVRWIGYQIMGYNIIQTAGIGLSSITFLLIVIFSIKEKRISIKHLPVVMFLGLTFYFMFATIIHPWYITTLVALTPFVRSRFAIVWSATIFISYFTYSNSGFTENLWLVAFEYLAVIAFLFWEWRTDRI